MRFLIAVFFLLATPLAAQVSFPKYTMLNSNLGQITIQNSNGQQQLLINGQPIAGLTLDKVYLHGIYNHAADGSQSVLVSLRHLVNGCFDDWVVLRISGNQVLPSAPFGSCGVELKALRADASGLEIDVNNGDLRYTLTTYRFDGKGFTATPVLRDDSAVAPAGSGAMVTRWANTYPSEIFQDASERRRFLTVMDVDYLDELKNSVSVSAGNSQEGDFIYGSGCFPHVCNAQAGAYAVRISDGAVFAVIWYLGAPARIAGAPLDGLPPKLRNFALTGSF